MIELIPTLEESPGCSRGTVGDYLKRSGYHEQLASVGIKPTEQALMALWQELTGEVTSEQACDLLIHELERQSQGDPVPPARYKTVGCFRIPMSTNTIRR